MSEKGEISHFHVTEKLFLSLLAKCKLCAKSRYLILAKSKIAKSTGRKSWYPRN